jgi:phosphoribosylformylglycinamidine cyclo-ligase
MLRTFNCGVGMVAIVRPDAAVRVMDVLASSGEMVMQLGQVIEAQGDERVVYDNHLDLRP